MLEGVEYAFTDLMTIAELFARLEKEGQKVGKNKAK